MTQGVYFCSNDSNLDWNIAFLKSFRFHNPSIPLCLIPLDSNVTSLSALASTYNFSIFSNTALLEDLDNFSLNFHAQVVPSFRRFAMFEGPYDEFVLLDSDSVILRDIEEVFDDLIDYDFITSHSDMPNLIPLVWNNTVYSSELSSSQIEYSANISVVVSKKNLFNLQYLNNNLAEVVALSSYMNLDFLDQAVLNAYVVTSEYDYTSMYKLRITHENVLTLTEFWAHDPIGTFSNGVFSAPGYERIFLMNWTVNLMPLPGNPNNTEHFDVWNYYYNLEI